MFVVDTNVFVYAANGASPQHAHLAGQVMEVDPTARSS